MHFCFILAHSGSTFCSVWSAGLFSAASTGSKKGNIDSFLPPWALSLKAAEIQMLKVQSFVQDMPTLDHWKKEMKFKISTKKQHGFYSITGPFVLPEKHLLILSGTSELSLFLQKSREVALRSTPQTKLMMFLLWTESYWEGSSYMYLLKTR